MTPMASTSSITTMALLPSSSSSTTTRSAIFNPIKISLNPMQISLNNRLPRSAKSRFEVRASKSTVKEQAVAGLTAAAMMAVMIAPDIAEAAQPGISPSLKNFLLSIVSGGVVLTAISGAVIGVSNFDPVKRT